MNAAHDFVGNYSRAHSNSHDRILSGLGRIGNVAKPKLKAKGKKLYKNTHGTICRVRPSFRLARLIRQRKTLRKLEAQVDT